jgi:hypothetical protein
MEETWMDVVRKPGSLVTALLTVVISVSLATWISHSLTGHWEARIVHAESQTAQATDALKTAETQLLANQQLLQQLMKDQRVRNDTDAEQRAVTVSELRDVQAELKMLHQAVFTMRPAMRSRRR